MLPLTYRRFLLTSDGAHASSLGPETHRWWTDVNRHGAFMDPELDTPPQGDAPVSVGYYAPLRDAILISRPTDAFKDLLVPRAGADGWELWTFASDGASAYRDPAAFLRNRINRPDRRPNAELADLYAAQVRDGSRICLDDLAEIGDPRVPRLAFA